MTRPVAELPARLVDPDEEYPTTLEEVARQELVMLWSDLSMGRRNAVNGVWSMYCDGIAYRIVSLTRILGAVTWEEMDSELVSSGLYERIHAEAGLEHPPVDWDALREFEARRAAEADRPLRLR